jgi:Zn-dependent peptidase ImmA (M78 family)
MLRRKLIAVKAAEVLNGAGQKSLPINVFEVAQALNIQVTEDSAPNEDVSGFLFIERGVPIIGLNVSNSEKRKRFTLAHEIGHFVLHHKGKGAPHIDSEIQTSLRFRDSLSSQGTDSEEIEANIFAAELLMPEPLVRKELDKYGQLSFVSEDDDVVLNLAQKCDVSVTAMTVRLSNLGLLKI